MRTDTLKLFGWELFGQPIRVSQLLSVVLALAGLAVLIVNKRKHPHGQENLFVNRQAALRAAAEAETDASMPEEDGKESGDDV